MTRSKMIKAGIVVVALGVFFLLGLLQDIGSWTILCSHPVTVQATVTGNEEHHNQKGVSNTYYPFAAYEVDGRQYEVLLDNSFGDRHYSPVPVGTQMNITVDGNRPTKVLKTPDLNTYIFGSLVFFMIAIGLCVLNASKKYI